MELMAIWRKPRFQLALLLAALVGGLLVGVNDRLDGSIESYNAGFYQGRFLRAYQRVGFWELEGRTLLGVIPTDTAAIERVYFHHPPFYPWLLQACVLDSRDIARYRLPSILASLALGLALWWFLRRAVNATAASCALLFLVLSPVLMRYGDMVNPEPFTVLFVFLAIASWKLDQRRVSLAWIFLATLMDWQGCFAVPAIAVMSETIGVRARVRELFIPFVVSVVGVMVTAGVFIYWHGGLGALDRLISLGNQSTTEGATVGGWFLNQGDYLFLGMGAAVALSGVVLCSRRMARVGERRMLAAFIVPGALNVLVFREHAFDHPFWWYLSLPGFCMGAGMFFEKGLADSRRLAAGALFLAVTLQIGLVVHDQQRELQPLSDQVERINRDIGANDLLMRGDEFGPEVFYLNCWTWDAAKDPAHVRRVLEAHREGRLDVEVVHYVLPDWVDRLCPGLRETLDAFGASVRLGKLLYYRFG